MKLRPRRIGVAALAASALLLLPASGYAATTIGSDLSGTPNDNACVGCTFVGFQDPAPLPQTSPIDGVVVRWRLKAGAVNNGDVALRVVTMDSSFNASAHSTGETRVAVPGTNEFPTRMAIAAGQAVGLDTSSQGWYFIGDSGGINIHLWNPRLVDGQPARAFDLPGTNVLLLNADVEPDVDRDGYGDETQDLCPGDASVQGACPPAVVPDVSPPALAAGARRAKLSKRGAISFFVNSNENATGVASGTVSVPKTARTVRFARRSLSFLAGQPTRVTLKLSKRNAALVRRALARKRKLKAKVTLTVRDAAGNAATMRIALRLRR